MAEVRALGQDSIPTESDLALVTRAASLVVYCLTCGNQRIEGDPRTRTCPRYQTDDARKKLKNGFGGWPDRTKVCARPTGGDWSGGDDGN